MKLDIFEGKRIKIIDSNNKHYEGEVVVYLPAHDNESGEEGIGLSCGTWFDESDIKSIKILEGTN